jgi:hypothetical protein
VHRLLGLHPDINIRERRTYRTGLVFRICRRDQLLPGFAKCAQDRGIEHGTGDFDREVSLDARFGQTNQRTIQREGRSAAEWQEKGFVRWPADRTRMNSGASNGAKRHSIESRGKQSRRRPREQGHGRFDSRHAWERHSAYHFERPLRNDP